MVKGQLFLEAIIQHPHFFVRRSRQVHHPLAGSEGGEAFESFIDGFHISQIDGGQGDAICVKGREPTFVPGPQHQGGPVGLGQEAANQNLPDASTGSGDEHEAFVAFGLLNVSFRSLQRRLSLLLFHEHHPGFTL